MTFKVEDGTGFTDSNSYGSVANADAYFLLRGIATWAALTQSLKEAALVAATDYIDGRFGGTFIGELKVATQALQWPRVDECDSEFVSMPAGLLKATYEYAIRASASPLLPDLQLDDSGRLPSRKTEKVGPLTEETGYAVRGPSADVYIYRPYPAADACLKGLVVWGQGTVVR